MRPQGRMQVCLRGFGLQVDHDAPEGFPNTGIERGFVDGAVFKEQVCKWNGFTRADSEPPTAK